MIGSSAYFLKQLPAGVFALVTKAPAHHAEDAPHAGLDIPSEAAGAVEIVAGAGTAVHQLHVERISDADCNLRRAAVADAFSGGRPALMNGC